MLLPSIFSQILGLTHRPVWHQNGRGEGNCHPKLAHAHVDQGTPTLSGFGNFNRRFIQNYSSIAGPLTDLLKRKPKSLSWTPSATESFNVLKETFISAPILVHPGPNKAFVVEVDASTTGVGAVLSQQQGTPAKLHPCAFSRKLSPAENNYDIGNRELLAIKLALEEWRHWLEGV